MNTRRHFPPYIVIALLVCAMLVAAFATGHQRARAQEPGVRVTLASAAVPQGGTVFVRIEAAARAVQLREGETTIPVCAREDGVWEALVPVPSIATPGTRTLRVSAEVGDGTQEATQTYTVTKRTFPVQRLRMSRDQEAKYEAPSVQEEYRRIGEALDRMTVPRAWQGGFRLPVDGRISTRYGVQRYRNGERVGIHRGIDIAARKGTPVYAAQAGTVVLRADFGMHGRTLAVDHGGGVVGIYLHLNDFGVSEGQVIKKDQLIARVGSTGVATGPHLHYALYVHGTAIDPLLWKTVPDGW